MEDFNLNPSDKFHKSDIWEYCTFLGKYVDSTGKTFDLGIALNTTGEKTMTGDWSMGIVFNSTPGSYISGGQSMYCKVHFGNQVVMHENNQECVVETLRRATTLNLIHVEEQVNYEVIKTFAEVVKGDELHNCKGERVDIGKYYRVIDKGTLGEMAETYGSDCCIFPLFLELNTHNETKLNVIVKADSLNAEHPEIVYYGENGWFVRKHPIV